MTRRLLPLVGAGCALVLALPAVIYLNGSVLLAVVLAAASVSGIAAVIGHRETDGVREATRTAVAAGAWALSAVMILTGTAFLVGATAASRIGMLAIPVVAIGWSLRRSRRARLVRTRAHADRASRPGRPAADHEGARLPNAPVAVVLLSTSALGREWLRTSVELMRPLGPAPRDALAARRHEVLDELERRDPAGFRAWLAAGGGPASNPAGFVRRT